MSVCDIIYTAVRHLVITCRVVYYFEEGSGGIRMSDLKTCPFCLEEVPARAVKCKYCESMIDDSPPRTADVSDTSAQDSFSGKGRKEPTPQGMNYQSFPAKKKGKKNLVPLVIATVLLLLIGAGVGYWFMFGNTGFKADEGLESDDILGSWRGTTADEEVYFEFMPNEMVRIAVPAEGYWFRTDYRIVNDDNYSYLELYHRETDEWERIAELAYKEPELLEMTDTWDGIVINMERRPDSEVGEVFRELQFER